MGIIVERTRVHKSTVKYCYERSFCKRIGPFEVPLQFSEVEHKGQLTVGRQRPYGLSLSTTRFCV